MLINFSIQNFGSIKEKQTLSFEADKLIHLEDYYVIHTNGLRLLKLGLIYGANASGKSTILKALDFLRTMVLYPKNHKKETFDLEPFKFDEHTPCQNTFFEIALLQNEVRYLYELELNNYAIVREGLYAYNPKKSTIFIRTTNLESQYTKIEFGNKIKVSKSAEETLTNNTLWNNTVLGGFLKTNIHIVALKEVTDWFSNYLNSSIMSHEKFSFYADMFVEKSEIQKQSIIEILRKADFNISNIKIERSPTGLPDLYSNGLPTTIEHAVNNNKYALSFEKESQGTQRYYYFAGILFLLKNNSMLFPIDELESSLHPDLFIHFLLSFLSNSKKSQIIATTHNREILNNKDIFRNDAIWITDKRNDSCATELYSLADFDTSVIRDTSNIYNAYKIGKLGGIPNLGDYYINIEDENE
ncbi:MAG: ATP-binding protein [Candidatus Symbiothrix sp.]|jgi:AAA15 family ATPase/GTPase|nr:ATP-binding protein [Candidatus Symbiothrix sp.]